MKTSLKNSTKAYFEQQALSDTQLNMFENMLNVNDDVIENKPTSTNNKASSNQYFTKWISIAAVVMLSISSVFFFNPPQSKQGFIIAKEVIENHIRLRPLEVTSDNFGVVGAYFTQLDFNVAPSHLITDNSDFKILGGRYCSIQTQIAAQIRYQDKKGDAHTLYQVGYEPETFDAILNKRNKQHPEIYDVDGYKVSIWVEKGLLMANVSPY